MNQTSMNQTNTEVAPVCARQVLKVSRGSPEARDVRGWTVPKEREEMPEEARVGFQVSFHGFIFLDRLLSNSGKILGWIRQRSAMSRHSLPLSPSLFHRTYIIKATRPKQNGMNLNTCDSFFDLILFPPRRFPWTQRGLWNSRCSRTELRRS